MNAIKALGALGPIDFMSVRRDSMLRWLFFIPILIALIGRWGTPVLQVRLLETFQLDIEPYYPLLVSFIVLVMPMMAGVVVGFLLLDQRDDQTLTALQVTPLSLTGYLTYRITLPTLLGLLMTLVAVPVVGLVQLAFVDLFLVALAAAPLAPLFALFLAAFSANKVQGFALMKASGAANWPPLIAYFVPGHRQLLFGIVPHYWPAKVFWMLEAGEPGFWVFLMVGWAYQSLLIWLLLKRFRRVMQT